MKASPSSPWQKCRRGENEVFSARSRSEIGGISGIFRGFRDAELVEKTRFRPASLLPRAARSGRSSSGRLKGLDLSAFAWILLHLFALVRAGSGTMSLADDPQRTDCERGLDLGLAGALVCFVAVNVFYNASNHHATMLLFVLLAAMISLRHSRRSEINVS